MPRYPWTAILGGRWGPRSAPLQSLNRWIPNPLHAASQAAYGAVELEDHVLFAGSRKDRSSSHAIGARVFEVEMPDKCLRFLTKTIHRPVVGRSPSAAVLMFACLLAPNFVAAQPPQSTEPVDVLDANSATVATLFVPRSSIQISEIAVLINDNDPQSVEVANYYQQVRNIPSR